MIGDAGENGVGVHSSRVAGTDSGSPSWSYPLRPLAGDHAPPRRPESVSLLPSLALVKIVSAVVILATGRASTPYAKRPRRMTGPLVVG